MPTLRRLLFAVAAVAYMSVGLVGMSDAPTARLTDDRSINVPRNGNAPREVLWTPAVPVEGAVNSSVDEYEPRISADGTTMVFVRRRPGSNADLFAARWTPMGWTEPIAIDGVNTEQDELGPELSRDGTTLYFYSDREGGLGGYDIWACKRPSQDDSWSTPTNLGPAINSLANEYGPGLTPDGTRLYFATNRARSDEPASSSSDAWNATLRERRARHDYDIYVAVVSAVGWSDAARVAAISTSADDGSPAVSPAGDFLYFASDREGGIGGYDLFRVRLAPSGELLADATVEPLGDAINSLANELDPGLASEGFRLYFSTDRASAGGLSGYELFTSVSREVRPFEEAAPASVASTGPGWWSDVWPWLLLLAILALLAWLLAMLFAHHDVWRKRVGRMSLLAQCLLLSLLLHLLIAALLAAWKVGGVVADRLNGGGHRVMLASAPADSADGELTRQIRGQTSGELANSTVASESFQVAATAPQMTIPEESEARSFAPDPMIAEAIPDKPPESQPETDAERMLLVVGSSSSVVPATPVAIEPSSVTEATREPIVSRTSPVSLVAAPAAAPVAAVVTPSSMLAPLPESTKIAVPPSLSAIASEIARSDQTSEPNREQVLSTGLPTSVPIVNAPVAVEPSAVTEATREPIISRTALVSLVAAPASAPAAAPLASVVTPSSLLAPLPESAKITVPPSPSATAGEIARSDQTAESNREQVLSTGLPTSVPIVNAGDATRPTAAPTTPSASEAARTSSAAATRALAPVRPNDAPAGSDVPLSISPAAPMSSSLPVAIGASQTASDASDAPPSPSHSVDLPTQAAAASTDAPRLPTAPAPVEDFAQRDPSIRSDLLERMGGNDETERAVGRALEWLKRRQAPDGHWSSRDNEAEVSADAAMTGLALLCFLGAGHTQQEEGPYRETVAKALGWLKARQRFDGDLRGDRSRPSSVDTMYGQTIATVALCEAYAMTRDEELAPMVRSAVDFVLARAADAQRGAATPQDTAVLGWLVMTVESARRAGFDPPSDVFDAARQWLDRTGVSRLRGRYAYRPNEQASPAMTAEAMFVQQLLGRGADEPRMKESADFVASTLPVWSSDAPTHHWYYATLALFQHQGETWKRWNEALVRELLAHQRDSGAIAGSWDPQDRWSRAGGRVYQTAVCTLSLEVYYRYRSSVAGEGRSVRSVAP